MCTPSPIQRVFWPIDFKPHSPGLIYGWVTPSGSSACVALTSPDVAGSKSTPVDRLKDVAAPSLLIESLRLLGACSTDAAPQSTPSSAPLHAHIRGRKSPQVFQGSGPVQVILYRRPNVPKHQYLSLVPIQLDLTSSARNPLPPPAEGEMEHIIRFINAAHAVNHPRGRGRIRTTIGQTKTNSSLSRIIHPLRALLSLPLLPQLRAPALKDVSATCAQLDVRLEQISFWSTQDVRREDGDVARGWALYVNFNNCLWLVANDAIIGYALGLFLRDNAVPLSRVVFSFVQTHAFTNIRSSILWLNAWPAGLKLHSELSAAITNSLISTMHMVEVYLLALAPHFPIILACLGYAGILGSTFILSLASDFLALLTAHLFGAYIALTYAFSWQLSILISLFRLFRGKRYNALRKRVEPAQYDSDTLLLGTVLFTLNVFLFPTVMTYYFFFALCRLAILAIHAGLETVLALLNHFPLFALMLRVKDARRLPGGIRIMPDARRGCLVCESVPITLSRIFYQYIALWARLAAHYSPLRLLGHVATGRPLFPIARYSMRYALPGAK